MEGLFCDLDLWRPDDALISLFPLDAELLLDLDSEGDESPLLDFLLLDSEDELFCTGGFLVASGRGFLVVVSVISSSSMGSTSSSVTSSSSWAILSSSDPAKSLVKNPFLKGFGSKKWSPLSLFFSKPPK